jgi:hypothetical protein
MSKVKSLTETCLTETGGLGLDCVIDQGGMCFSVLGQMTDREAKSKKMSVTVV